MRQNYFFEYVPNAYINLCVDKAQQMANNRFVYDFKAGEKKAAHLCAEWLVRYLTKQYSSILEDFVVVFAPCSTQWKYNKRFGYLAAILNAAGIATANEHVHIFGERKPTHNGGSHFVNEDIYHVSLDGEYFNGKQVILFDDLLTSGKTIEDFRSKLEAAGTAESLSQARQLINMADNNLSNLAKLSMDEMQVVQGIGDCKALAVLAALELGKRRAVEKLGSKPDMGSSLAIYNYMLPQMADLKVEQAHVILMNQNFRLIKSVKLSEGGITETSVDIRILMREAVLSGATIMAFVHNHPSGNTQPSKADDVLTQQIAKACQVMRLFFMDHVIVTDGAFYSYHDKGRL